MTRSPGEVTAIENKQATAGLPPTSPTREYNKNCNMSNLCKHFITTLLLLCMCIQRSLVQSRNPVQV